MILYTCICVIERRSLGHQHNEEDYLQITFQRRAKIYDFQLKNFAEKVETDNTYMGR